MKPDDAREICNARHRNADLTIHATRAHERGIEQLRVIARADHDHTVRLGDAIELLEKSVHEGGPILGLLFPATLWNGIQLVDEQHARCQFYGTIERLFHGRHGRA